MDHRREIDGLRTIAVLPVILSHARFGLVPGTERGAYRCLGPFLQNWDCLGRGGNGLIPTGIAIYTDSHAADIAGALWLNGFDALELTGNGCSLTPSLMNPP